ncbi:hypothetical protein PISMIDRAFT_11303 [Pisolithus microcarpus 441]|uniref:Uncharacterized protein n=1 Tax=Pisolithus microcarpus 441 TaxID=765257 RepID=A0A0C9Z1N9_9AGAM|nr:hypothetical protein BKA83DRAFT_11303 [Pisolithus microcarpus]KIK22941.1 hypothetical protein PISMIDRAFT_11303 [Pisolithus microcarpus 441]
MSAYPTFRGVGHPPHRLAYPTFREDFDEEDLHDDGKDILATLFSGNLECVKNSLEKVLQSLGRGKEENWDLEQEDGTDLQQSESDGGEIEDDDVKEVETDAEGAA